MDRIARQMAGPWRLTPMSFTNERSSFRVSMGNRRR